MRFPYLGLPTRRPAYSLGGARVRYRPIVPVHIIGPQLLPPLDACIDCAADDTLFPVRLASRLGIDLTGAPHCPPSRNSCHFSRLIASRNSLLSKCGHSPRKGRTYVGVLVVWSQ